MGWDMDEIAEEALQEVLLEGEELVMPEHLSWQFSGVAQGSMREVLVASGQIVNHASSRHLFSRETILNSLESAQRVFMQRVEKDLKIRPPTVKHFVSGLELENPAEGWTLVHNHQHGFSGEPD